MKNEQYLLAKLAEEASEIAQISLKTMQFGFHETHPDLNKTNLERIHEELNDLNTIIRMLNTYHDFNYKMDELSIKQKWTQVELYNKYSKSLGMVE